MKIIGSVYLRNTIYLKSSTAKFFYQNLVYAPFNLGNTGIILITWVMVYPHYPIILFVTVIANYSENIDIAIFIRVFADIYVVV